MPNNWIHNSGQADGIVIGQSLSRFVPLSGQLEPVATEVNTQCLARAAYTWENIGTRVIQNNLDATTSVFARLNGADQSALEVQIGANSTGFFEDDTGSVSVADGDLINYRIATAAGAMDDTIEFTVIMSQLQHASLTRPIAIIGGDSSLLHSNTAYHPVVGGAGSPGAIESEAQLTLRQDVTFSNFRIVVTENSISNVSTVNFREGGANTSLSFSIAASTTGSFEDTDSEVVTTGSSINYQIVTGVGHSANRIVMSVYQLLQAGDVTGRILGNGSATPNDHPINVTRNLPLEAILEDFSTTESEAQVEAPFDFDVTDMIVRVIFNCLTTATTTITLRADGFNTFLGISIAALSTGIFEDSDTISIGVDELINWQLIVANSGSGEISVSIIALEQVQPVEVSVPRRRTAFATMLPGRHR